MTEPITEPAMPVRLAIQDDCDLVTSGLRAMLAPYPRRARLVDDQFLPRTTTEVDILLADVFARPAWVPRSGPILVAYSWHESPAEVTRAMVAGAQGFITKAAPCAALLDALDAVLAGERVVCVSDEPRTPPALRGVQRDLTTRLSQREAEVLSYVTEGLTNHEIAERLFLSINSVKTYVRCGYRKIRVSNRAQAVRWGIENGMGASPRVALRSVQ